MLIEDKMNYFEYFIYRVYEWYGKENDNDLSVLKLMKLLFFTTAVNSKNNSENILINNVFNNYVAMPFGHVESSIYGKLRDSNQLKFFELSNSKTIRKKSYEEDSFREFFEELELKYLTEIDKSIDILKHKNSNLINYSAFNLVELSHKWYSWRKFYNEGKQDFQRSSSPIPSETIIEEDKYFETLHF